jgi:hypothetical protein
MVMIAVISYWNACYLLKANPSYGRLHYGIAQIPHGIYIWMQIQENFWIHQ